MPPHRVILHSPVTDNTYAGMVQEGASTGAFTCAANGNKYTGQFIDSHITGYGILAEAGGRTTHAYFIDGLPTGAGVHTYSNCDTVLCSFASGMAQGPGVVRSASGDLYEGDLTEHVKHGLGVIVHGRSRTTYTGEWDADKRHGKGQVAYASGFTRDRIWLNDEDTCQACDDIAYTIEQTQRGMSVGAMYLLLSGIDVWQLLKLLVAWRHRLKSRQKEPQKVMMMLSYPSINTAYHSCSGPSGCSRA